MPIIEIESQWRETGIGCIHCGEMTYSDGGPRQCVDPGCPFFALPQPELVADPSQVTPPSPNALDGDKMTMEEKGVSTPEIILELEKLRRRHTYCEGDCWYLCPKCSEGCCDDSQGDDCNCGADEHNSQLDKIIDYARALVNRP